MSWRSESLGWSQAAQAIQTSSENVLNQVTDVVDQSTVRVSNLASHVAFPRHPLSAEAEALLHLRAALDALLIQGQILSVHPYLHNIGSRTESGYHLSPDEAVSVLAGKLKDTVDKHHPKGQLHVVGWMIAENSIANFANSTQALFDVVNIPELGMVARRLSKEQSLNRDKMVKPNAIAQPRFKPNAHINPDPLRSVEHWQGAQIAQLESLAADRQTPVAKLASLAEKRKTQLSLWSQALNDLKQSGITLHKFEERGTPDVIATQLQQSQPPSRANSFTFACLFISSQPLTFISELFHDSDRS